MKRSRSAAIGIAGLLRFRDQPRVRAPGVGPRDQIGRADDVDRNLPAVVQPMVVAAW